MKKTLLVMLMITVLSLMLVNTAFAAPSAAGSCKRGSTMVLLPAGVKPGTDRNGDGYVCSMLRSAGRVVYLDNFNRSRCGSAPFFTKVTR